MTVLVENGNGDSQKPEGIFLIVDRETIGFDGLHRFGELSVIGDRVRCQPRQFDGLKILPQFVRLQLRQQQFSDRRAVSREPAAGDKLEAQRPVAFDSLDIDDFMRIEQPDIAGLAYG
jgi:hypothetical protein